MTERSRKRDKVIRCLYEVLFSRIFELFDLYILHFHVGIAAEEFDVDERLLSSVVELFYGTFETLERTCVPTKPVTPRVLVTQYHSWLEYIIFMKT